MVAGDGRIVSKPLVVGSGVSETVMGPVTVGFMIVGLAVETVVIGWAKAVWVEDHEVSKAQIPNLVRTNEPNTRSYPDRLCQNYV